MIVTSNILVRIRKMLCLIGSYVVLINYGICVCSVLQENPTFSIDLVCKMEEIENINPVLADLVMDAGYRAIDKLCSKVVNVWQIL